MGSATRMKPAKLGEKLLAIRKKFDYSLSQMANRLSCEQIRIPRTDISRFEKGQREPNLIILLHYAKLAGVTIEMLVDDKIELPKEFLKK